jgi:hypothetical protein
MNTSADRGRPSAASSVVPTIAWQFRRIPLSRARHVCGRVPIAGPAYAVNVESRLEREALLFLTRQAGFHFVRSQPFTLNYHAHGRRLRYTPDLLVIFDPVAASLRRLGFSFWTVVEVKPWAHLQAQGHEVRERLAHVAATTGFATVILTERDIAPRGGQPS